MPEIKNQVSLCNFYLFNSTYGTKEGEEEQKILFFHPEKVDSNSRVKIVGLSEAIIKFTGNFISDEKCKSVHMLKTRQLFYQPESNYWMVMTLNLPQRKVIDKFNEVVCPCEIIRDDLFFCILKRAYEIFILFFGSFQSYLNADGDVSDLKMKLRQFFTEYLHTTKIPDCDVVDVFQGMQFLPLDKKTYLHAHSFMNLLHSTFGKRVEFSALWVKNHLVWSNVEASDLRIINRYLETNLLASHSTTRDECEQDLSKRVPFANDSNSFKFITYLPIYYDHIRDSSSGISKVFVKRKGKRDTVFKIVVCNVLSSFVCLFVPETVELTSDFLTNIENFMKLRLMPLASELSLHAEKKRALLKTSFSSSGNPFSYIYFNRLNLAQKNTLRENKSLLSSEVLSILSDVCFSEKNRHYCSGETILRTYDDFWIIGQFCNEREFYVITQHKNTSLIDINDEMKKICDKQLKSIFFHV